MWWCVKISIYLAIFSIGGVGITIMGIIYIYFKLFRKITKPGSEDREERDTMLKEQEENDYYQQVDVDIKI